MINRKEFLHRSFLAAFAASVGIKASAKNTKPFLKLADSENLPVTIATWKNEKATAAAMEILLKGGSSLDAVEAGARVPEADPEDTSVGYGGYPDRDGFVTLDAAIMDYKGNAGSVTFLQHIMHPVSVARLVMEKTPHVMLSGEGALQFALANGFKKENLLTETSKKAWEEWKKENNYTPPISEKNHDTIGILAIDNQNNIAGACSTSGWAYKMRLSNNWRRYVCG
jgi:N4-(beta-N-acetylglucosaminyl)-L-asparaginase